MAKQKAEALVDSDSEVEVIAGPSQPKRQHVAGTTFTSTHLFSSSLSSHPPTYDLESSPSLSLSPLPFPVFSPLSTPSSASTLSPSPTHPSWPIGCYAIDMMKGFACVDGLMKTKPPVKDHHKQGLMEHVKTVFGVTVPYSTYRDQRTKWLRAPQALRDKVIEGGRTPNGLWGYLASRVRRCAIEVSILGRSFCSLVLFAHMICSNNFPPTLVFLLLAL